MDWLEIDFVKGIISRPKPYELGIFIDNKWHRVIYNGMSDEGLWFIELDKEFLLPKEEIISNKDSFRYKMVEKERRSYGRHNKNVKLC